MKTICIDVGNTFVKVAFAEESIISSVASFSIADTNGLLDYVRSLPQADGCIMASVRSDVNRQITDILTQKSAQFMELTAATPLPFRNMYKTPETLGKDRLAAIAGAYSLCPEENILVFDAGTALTIDFIGKDGNYRGGNISPGLNMRFRALHDYTEKLFLLSQTDDYEILGDKTSSAIVSGVQNGMVFEVKYYIEFFVKKFPDLKIFLTGGDIKFLVNKIEMYTFAEPNLVLIGLDSIINFNLISNK